MKRSEMLDLILDVLETSKENEDHFLKVRDDMLDTIEKAGMLPPIHEDIPDDDQEYIGYAMGEFHNWEKEDEEK